MCHVTRNGKVSWDYMCLKLVVFTLVGYHYFIICSFLFLASSLTFLYHSIFFFVVGGCRYQLPWRPYVSRDHSQQASAGFSGHEPLTRTIHTLSWIFRYPHGYIKTGITEKACLFKISFNVLFVTLLQF